MSGTRASNASDARAAEMMAPLLDLAALLVQPGESPAIETRALELGARLVPRVTHWRLFAGGASPSDPLHFLADAGAAATARNAPPAPGPVSTLGFGPVVDRLVLAQRQPAVLDTHAQSPATDRATVGDATPPARSAGLALPLVAGDGILYGALVAVTRPRVALTGAERQLIETVASHLTILLARQRHQPAADPSAAPANAGDERMAFISLAAHELRSPLTSVKGYAQLLLRSARKDPEYPQNSLRALQAIEQQSSRMSDMVAELLDASRMQRGVFELHNRPAELDALVLRAVEQRRPSLENHELRLEMADQNLEGDWDSARVEQVTRDLLDNAIRYSPDGGIVSVRVARVDGVARVCVQDQGIGVPGDEREVIFEPFARGATAQRRNLSGLGLGLYVSRTIVEVLGGRLWLAASGPEPMGSLFCFELPLTGTASARP